MTLQRTVPTTTPGRKAERLRELAASVATVDGDAIECGVWKGGSIGVIATALPGKRVLGFDTFSGLPQEKWSVGERHRVGEFSETSIHLARYNVYELSNVLLVDGIFPTSAAAFTDVRFAFAYIDFDYYKSTRDAIEWIWPRLNQNGLMVFDDYEWPMCPGVRRAIDEVGLPVEPSGANYQVFARKP